MSRPEAVPPGKDDQERQDDADRPLGQKGQAQQGTHGGRSIGPGGVAPQDVERDHRQNVYGEQRIQRSHAPGDEYERHGGEYRRTPQAALGPEAPQRYPAHEHDGEQRRGDGVQPCGPLARARNAEHRGLNPVNERGLDQARLTTEAGHDRVARLQHLDRRAREAGLVGVHERHVAGAQQQEQSRPRDNGPEHQPVAHAAIVSRVS